MKTTKKITLATIKSFIRKNQNNLYIKRKKEFNATIDMVDNCQDQSINKAKYKNPSMNDLGIIGAWFVRRNMDSFKSISIEGFKGYNIHNCCGEFNLLIKE